jgi:hypothetical protein
MYGWEGASAAVDILTFLATELQCARVKVSSTELCFGPSVHSA